MAIIVVIILLVIPSVILIWYLLDSCKKIKKDIKTIIEVERNIMEIDQEKKLYEKKILKEMNT